MRSEFLAELFTEADDIDGRSALVQRASAAAEASGEVRFVRSIFVPDDEICFLVFEAESAAAVTRLAEQAALPLDRVVRAELGAAERDTKGASR
jgi:hypothetical protein